MQLSNYKCPKRWLHTQLLNTEGTTMELKQRYNIDLNASSALIFSSQGYALENPSAVY